MRLRTTPAAQLRSVLLLCWRDTGHPQGGGSERYLEQVGAQLAARGIKVTLRTARYQGAAKSESRDGIAISRGGGRFTVYPRALAAILLGRIGLGPLRHVRADAVIDTQNGIPFFASTVAGVPATVLVHHGHREQWPVAGRLTSRVGWWVESSLSPWVHRKCQYLTVSLPSADELVSLGIARERIAVVRNGIDPAPAIDGTISPQPRLVVLSRLVPHKQIEHVLDVVAALGERVPGLRCDVIGGGWWADNLAEYAATLGVTGSVTFHGHVSEEEKHQILSAAWVHVMPSRKEGWGLAVIEAAQHGVPTVGYRSSRGLTDSIVDGVTGMLVDDQAGLANACYELLTDSETRRTQGSKARARAGEFSWDQCAAGVFDVLAASARNERVSGLISGNM